MAIKRLVAAIVALLQTLGVLIFNFPIVPNGQKLDMSKFTDECVWADEFDTDELDHSKWQDNFHISDTSIVQRGGYWNSKMVSVKDGALHITSAYLPEGLDGGPAGFYGSGIDTEDRFEQLYGYFEVRCILPKGGGKWSAFWLRSHDGPENGDDLEIDIMESPNYAKSGRDHNVIVHNIHMFNNYEVTASKKTANVYVKGNPYEEFHTYGVEWNEDEMIFYVDGIESARRNTKDVPMKEVYIMLTVEIGGSDGVPGESWVGAPIVNDKDLPSNFIIDYVRVYQYK